MGNGDVGFSKLSQGMQSLVAFLVIIGMVVPCVLGFVNFDKRLDVSEDRQERHILKDDKFRDEVGAGLNELDDKVQSLQLIDKELEIKYAEIIRRLDKAEVNDARIIEKLDNLVRAE